MDILDPPRRRLSTTNGEPAGILVVDDQPANIEVLGNVLHKEYRVYTAKDGRRALEIARSKKPNLILLDIMMPGMSGYDVVRALKRQAETANIPVIFVTAIADVENERLGFEYDAVDYITKPVNPAIVRARVRTHLSLVKADQLQETRLEIIRRLGHAAEYRDNETGLHVIRMSHYARILGLAAGLTENEGDQLLNAAPMHDVGKIGIPDHILLKPGKLDQEEWRLMRTHPEVGAEIIGNHESSLLRLAASISLTHHEKWNGQGYPRGLEGESIPLEGRIVAIADVFDALTTERPYKRAWPVEEAVALIRNEAGEHFDPELVTLFLERLPAVLEVRERWMEGREMRRSA